MVKQARKRVLKPLLVYFLQVGPEPLSEEMVSVQELQDAHFFQGPHELKGRPLLQRFGNNVDGSKRAVEPIILCAKTVELQQGAHSLSRFIGTAGLASESKKAPFLTVAAKHCRQAEHSLQLAAGSFKSGEGSRAVKFKIHKANEITSSHNLKWHLKYDYL
jgi:hypothetical protein